MKRKPLRANDVSGSAGVVKKRTIFEIQVRRCHLADVATPQMPPLKETFHRVQRCMAVEKREGSLERGPAGTVGQSVRNNTCSIEWGATRRVQRELLPQESGYLKVTQRPPNWPDIVRWNKYGRRSVRI